MNHWPRLVSSHDSPSHGDASFLHCPQFLQHLGILEGTFAHLDQE
jgi:hypothetical protein